jgi:hypothetical protein
MGPRWRGPSGRAGGSGRGRVRWAKRRRLALLVRVGVEVVCCVSGGRRLFLNSAWSVGLKTHHLKRGYGVRRMKSAVLLIGIIIASPASAQKLTGNELLARCKAENDERTSCLTYVQAVGALFTIVQTLGVRDRDRTRLYCLPSNVTLDQTVDVVVSFLEQNPAIRHEDAAMLTVAALRETFPCPSRR